MSRKHAQDQQHQRQPSSLWQPANLEKPRHRYEYRASLLVRLHQCGLYDPWEMDHSGPLSFAVRLPYDIAVQQSCHFARPKIAMEVEVLCVGRLVASPKVDLICRRLPFGREDQSDVVTSGVRCGLLDLVDREV